MKIKINNENEYEAYVDDTLIYKFDNILCFLEGVIWKTISKEGTIIDVLRNYVNKYKELLKLCKNISSRY